MTTPSKTDLARLTIVSPYRRIDVAIPDSIPVAEMLPSILAACGESAADEGQTHGGWILRRDTGAVVSSEKSLSSQGVHDGAVLHLVSRQTEWPELDYDDVVDAIATSARGRNRAWTGSTTRIAGLTISAIFLLAGAVVALSRHVGQWGPLGIGFLAVAAALLVAAGALSRAVSDATAGAIVGTIASIYAAIGGTVVLNHADPLFAVGPAQVMLGAASLIVAASIGYAAVAHETQWFVAAIATGILALIGAGAARIWDLPAVESAAVVAAVTITLAPAFPLLSIRLGKLPVPALPTSAEDLLADPEHPALSRVHATVKRSDEILQGLLLASSGVLMWCEWELLRSGRVSALWLLAVVALSTLLRARLMPVLAHRRPVLICGAFGGGIGALALVISLTRGIGATYGLAAIAALGLIVLAIGLYFRLNRPTPLLGRIADIADIVLMLAVVPLTCLVVGLFGYIRGLAG